MGEAAKVRAIYEELVLKKPQPTVVQIGSVSDIAKAVPANFTNAKQARQHRSGSGQRNRPRTRRRRLISPGRGAALLRPISATLIMQSPH